jgi:hypothetical protein
MLASKRIYLSESCQHHLSLLLLSGSWEAELALVLFVINLALTTKTQSIV